MTIQFSRLSAIFVVFCTVLLASTMARAEGPYGQGVYGSGGYGGGGRKALAFDVGQKKVAVGWVQETAGGFDLLSTVESDLPARAAPEAVAQTIGKLLLQIAAPEEIHTAVIGGAVRWPVLQGQVLQVPNSSGWGGTRFGEVVDQEIGERARATVVHGRDHAAAAAETSRVLRIGDGSFVGAAAGHEGGLYVYLPGTRLGAASYTMEHGVLRPLSWEGGDAQFDELPEPLKEMRELVATRLREHIPITSSGGGPNSLETVLTGPRIEEMGLALQREYPRTGFGRELANASGFGRPIYSHDLETIANAHVTDRDGGADGARLALAALTSMGEMLGKHAAAEISRRAGEPARVVYGGRIMLTTQKLAAAFRGGVYAHLSPRAHEPLLTSQERPALSFQASHLSGVEHAGRLIGAAALAMESRARAVP